MSDTQTQTQEGAAQVGPSPAPWVVSGRIILSEPLMGGANGVVACCIESILPTGRDPRVQANARLIAQSPAMLALLRDVAVMISDLAGDDLAIGRNVEYWNRGSGYGFQMANRIADVIAAATGEGEASHE